MRHDCIVTDPQPPHPYAERGRILRNKRVMGDRYYTGRELAAMTGIWWLEINNAEAGKVGTLPTIEMLEAWWADR